MKRLKKVLSLVIILSMVLSLFACTSDNPERDHEALPFTSYEEIPDITQEEIVAIGALREEVDFFTYGIPISTEAFINQEGEIEGFSALLCQWLTDLFEIEFRPVNYEFTDLITALENGEVDFAGGLAPTPERKEKYYMTDPIVERSLMYFHLSNQPNFSEAFEVNPEDTKPRIAFLENSATTNLALSILPSDRFEPVFVQYNEQAYELIVSGEVDGFIHQSTTKILFEENSDIGADSIYPPAFIPVAFTAARSELEPIISVIQKSLTEEQLNYLTNLYNQGEGEYVRHVLFSRLTEDEMEYIKNNPVIPLAAESSNYPISFYNQHESQWQGISFDVLQEVSELTGFTFEVVSEVDSEWTTLMELLESGEATMISELLPLEKKEDRFLLSEGILLLDRPVLISSFDHHYIQLNEVLYTRIGLVKDTVYFHLFHTWFPYATNLVEYDHIDEALDGLIHGDVEMVMLSESKLLNLTNYREQPGYKANLIFDYHIESTLGFNENEELLHSIIDKSLELIDTKEITNQWLHRTFDYRAKLVEAQIPWIASAAALFICVLGLIIILMVRKHFEHKKLWHFQNAILTIIADLIESRDLTTGRHIINTQKYLNCLIKKCIEMDVYKEELSKWKMSELLLSAQLHDVGKISVSDVILNKPGKLTEDEFLSMKSHAQVGVNIITHMEESIDDSEFLVQAKKFVGTHHEKWDGTGYPEGLKGVEIPLEGRLLAIADVYDALVSKRPYKEPFSSEKAAQIIGEGSGTHFDPALVEVFKQVVGEFAKIEREV